MNTVRSVIVMVLLLGGLVFLYSPQTTFANTIWDDSLSKLTTALTLLQTSLSGTQTAYVSGGVDSNPPSTPTNFAGSALSDTAINLTWKASTDDTQVLGYNVYQDGGKFSVSNELTHTILHLSPGTTYSFYIRAYDTSLNESAPTQTIHITTKTSSAIYACSNNFDDDGDGDIDYPNDPGCSSSKDNDEYNTPNYCTYKYSDWEDCQSSNTQYREVVSTSPSGCVPGTPILIQACSYKSYIDSFLPNSNSSDSGTSVVGSSAGDNSATTTASTTTTTTITTTTTVLTPEQEEALRQQLLSRIEELRKLIVNLTLLLLQKQAAGASGL